MRLKTTFGIQHYKSKDSTARFTLPISIAIACIKLYTQKNRQTVTFQASKPMPTTSCRPRTLNGQCIIVGVAAVKSNNSVSDSCGYHAQICRRLTTFTSLTSPHDVAARDRVAENPKTIPLSVKLYRNHKVPHFHSCIL